MRNSLEQWVDYYLQAAGYFTSGNLQYTYVYGTGSKTSDIDVVGVRPPKVLKRTQEDIVLVSCKGAKAGLKSAKLQMLIDKVEGHTLTEKRTVEYQAIDLIFEKARGHGVKDLVRSLTGTSNFQFWVVCFLIDGESQHEEQRQFKLPNVLSNNLCGQVGMTIKVVTLAQLVGSLSPSRLAALNHNAGIYGVKSLIGV